MVANSSFHFDDDIYRRLLDDGLTRDKKDSVSTHIEQCVDCQTRLEALAEENISWGDVRRFLRPGARDSACDSARANSAEGDVEQENTRPLQAPDFLIPSDAPGSLGRFGRYEIEEVIGSGGMGVVLKGFDKALSRYAAIKVLAPALATSAAARQRFSREAQSAAAVVHQHVVPIHTVDEERTLPYFVMPLVGGRSLQQRVAEKGALDVQEVLRIGMQTAAGLAAAHKQGLVHRDVKPANILLENGVERVLITDFGLARAVDDASVTRSGVIVGTPQYMSPEQARGENVDQRSDLFSLGSVLYFMCTGRSPFRAETTMGVLRRISDDRARPIREINPLVPDWLEAMIDKLLAKAPAERFQSATEVAELFGQWLAHLQSPSTAPQPQAQMPARQAAGGRTKRPLRWMAALAAGALLFAMAVSVYVKLGETTVRFEIEDPALAVRFGESEITLDNDGEKIQIRPGDENSFVVLQNGAETVGSSFRLKRGDKVLLRVATATDGDVVIKSDPELALGRRRIPKRPSVAKEEADPKLQERIEAYERAFRLQAELGGATTVRVAERPRQTITLAERVGCIDFSPDGKHLVAAVGNVFHVFDAPTGRMVRQFKGRGILIAVCVAYSPDGKLLVSAGNHGKVQFWDVASGQQVGATIEYDRDAHWVAFSPDGRLVATANRQRKGKPIELWTAPGGEKLKSLAGAAGGVNELSFSPAGKLLAGAESRGGGVRVWDMSTGKLKWTGQHECGAASIQFSPDGKLIASGGWDNELRLWNVRDGELVWKLETPGRLGVNALQWSPDGRALIFGLYEGTVGVVEIESGRIVQQFNAHDDKIYRIALSPDGRTIATCSADRTVKLWDVLTPARSETTPADQSGENGNNAQKPVAPLEEVLELEKSADQLDPSSDGYAQVLIRAAAQYHAIYNRYRSKGAGVCARFREGKCYYKLKRFDEALLIFDEVRKLDFSDKVGSSLVSEAAELAEEIRATQKADEERDEPDVKAEDGARSTSESKPAASDAASLVKGVVDRFDAIRSGSFTYHLKSRITDVHTDATFRFVFDGPSWRLNQLNDATGHLETRIEINHGDRRFDYTKTAGGQSTVEIRSPQAPLFENRPWPPLRAGTVWFTETRDYLREHVDEVRHLGARKINDVETQLVEIDVPAENVYEAFHSIGQPLQNGGVLKVYVAPQLGHAVVRVEHVDLHGLVQGLFDYADFQEAAPGVYFPAKVHIIQGTESWYDIRLIDKVNESISATTFEADFPPAVVVRDLRSQNDPGVER